MLKKVLSVILCLALTVGLIPIPGLNTLDVASAKGVFSNPVTNIVSITENGVKHDAKLTPWDGKAGSTAPETTVVDGETFYLIEDGADLAWFANKVNNGNTSADSTNRESNAMLVNDIDLNNQNWNSFQIGPSYQYAGIFDGQGHTIYNFYLETSAGGGGFFSRVGITGKGATIKNVKFANAKSISTYTGDYKKQSYELTSIVCGYMSAQDTVMENVSVSGRISVKSSSHGVIGAGSIVGHLKKGTVKNCYSDVVIDLENARNLVPDFTTDAGTLSGVGGIVGVWEATKSDGDTSPVTTITQCGFEGTINAPKNSRVGGVIGQIAKYQYFSFSRSYSTADVTGYRQVGGVVGWGYDGKNVYHSPLWVYSTGTVTAKTADKSYAAGIANGYKEASTTYPVCFMGDVVVDATVDGVKAPEFNDTCALLFTTLETGDRPWDDKLFAAYIPRYYGDTAKHIISQGDTTVSSAANVKAHTEEEFRDGTVIPAFKQPNYPDRVQYFTNMEGLNDGLVVLTWQAEAPVTNATTYYVADESIAVEFDSEGSSSFTIAPVGGSAVVTIDGDSKVITKKDSYTFKFNNKNTSINVEGKAFITKDITKKEKPAEITELTASKIKVSFNDTESRDVVLALYKDGDLIDVVYNRNAQPENVGGDMVVSATIDLTGKDVKDCTLKGFLWENGTLAPIEEYVYIGKTIGEIATEEQKIEAVKIVAQSYLDRGELIQYDNSDLNNTGYGRYDFGRSPESYTSAPVRYINEISLCYNIYKEALNIDIPRSFNELVSNDAIKVAETDASSFNKEYFDEKVMPGDIIAFSSDNKLMLYIGDNTVIYATGESYDYSENKDAYETNGAVVSADINSVFENINEGKVIIVRPLDIKKEIVMPKKTTNRIENLQGIVAEKTSSFAEGRTAELGEEITFTFSVENKNETPVSLSVSDVIPAQATFVSGCDNVKGKNLSWNVELNPGETKTFSYKVKIKSDESYYGKTLGNNATIGGVSLPCADIKIARTFKANDIKNLKKSLQAMSSSEFTGSTLAKWIYTVAFTKSFTMTGTASEILHQVFVEGNGGNAGGGTSGEEASEAAANFIQMTVPTMYGGKTVESNMDKLFSSKRTTMADKKNLVAGDILIAQKNEADGGRMYMYDGDELIELTNGMSKIDNTDEIIKNLISYDMFIAVRPSIVMNNFIHFKDSDDVELTPLQEAVVETAKAYFLRGGSYQYDDTRITTSVDSTDEYRWMIRKAAPEDATTKEWSYSNCAAFTYDVYYFGLGFDIVTWNTTMFHQNSPKSRIAYQFAKTGKETEAEKKAVEETIINTLQPGDIIVIKRDNASNSGHAMLYIGNETILHSGGSNFNYSSQKEVYEPTVRIKHARDLFLEGETVNVFGIVKTIDIIRPLNDFKGSIPQNTLNRVANMKGIRAEKLSSHTSSMTVNPGDEMTFTFSVYNTNKEAVTLDIKDVIPANTDYISGADKKDGNNLSWSVTVKPEETKTVSYKVRVKTSASAGASVDCSKGSVGGVTVKCPNVKIGRTLTASEQTAVTDAIASLKGSGLSGINLANKIYENVLGIKTIFPEYNNDGSLTNADILDATFKSTTLRNNFYLVNEDTTCGQMLAFPLYGGRYYYSTRWENIRTRLPRKQHLIKGDILVQYTGSQTMLSIFDGENLLDLNNNFAKLDTNTEFEKAMSRNRFAVLRPSLSVK